MEGLSGCNARSFFGVAPQGGFAIHVPTRNCAAHRVNGPIRVPRVAAPRQSRLRATSIGDAVSHPNYKQ